MTRPPQGRGEREGALGCAWSMKIYCFNEITKEVTFIDEPLVFRADRAKEVFECVNGHVCLYYSRPYLIMFRCDASFKNLPNTEYVPFMFTSRYYPSGDPIKEMIGDMEAFR